MLCQWISNQFPLIEGMTEAGENKIPMLAIKGRAGDGKTMLLGKFALHLEVKRWENIWYFYSLEILVL